MAGENTALDTGKDRDTVEVIKFTSSYHWDSERGKVVEIVTCVFMILASVYWIWVAEGVRRRSKEARNELKAAEAVQRRAYLELSKKIESLEMRKIEQCIVRAVEREVERRMAH